MWQLDARHPDIDRLTDHMQTVRRDARARATPLPEHGVGFRRSVAGNDVKRLIALQRLSELVQQIEDPGIDWLDLVHPEVTHDVVEFRESLGAVASAGAICRLQPLASVRVEERQRAFWRPGDS